MNQSCAKVLILSMKNNGETLSKNILEATPKIMRFIREEMRLQAKGELTVPQFRVILKLVREPNITQQEVAEWMGIAAPTLTKMLDTLVRRKLVKRTKDTKDLRRTLLQATLAGEKIHQIYKKEVQTKLLLKTANLSTSEKEKISEALILLSNALA